MNSTTQRQIEDLIIDLLQQQQYSVQKTTSGLRVSLGNITYEIPVTAQMTNSSQISRK